MTPLLALLLGQRSFDGEDAITAARTFLKAVGITRPGWVERLGRQDGKGWQQNDSVWSVRFSEASSGSCDIWLRADGTVIALYSGRQHPFGQVTPEIARRRAQALLRAIPNLSGMKLENVALDSGGFYQADLIPSGREAKLVRGVLRFWPYGELTRYEGFERR